MIFTLRARPGWHGPRGCSRGRGGGPRRHGPGGSRGSSRRHRARPLSCPYPRRRTAGRSRSAARASRRTRDRPLAHAFQAARLAASRVGRRASRRIEARGEPELETSSARRTHRARECRVFSASVARSWAKRVCTPGRVPSSAVSPPGPSRTAGVITRRLGHGSRLHRAALPRTSPRPPRRCALAEELTRRAESSFRSATSTQLFDLLGCSSTTALPL